MTHCLIFEASSIHDYLSASGRLRHIVGASELIESLCGATLDEVIEALDLHEKLVFSRRAGGVFQAYADSRAPLEQLAAVWSLRVREVVPGLPFKLALGEGADWKSASKAARDQADGSRGLSERSLPLATPFSARHALTGEAATDVLRGESIDAATARKLQAADAKANRLGQRYLPGSTWGDWPLDLSAEEGGKSRQVFPFLDQEQSLALLVADGNGLGQLLIRLFEEAGGLPDRDYAAHLLEFSRNLEEATTAAAQRAVREVVEPQRDAGSGILPMRPILLGGDDVVVLIRADLALPFAEAFARAFEQETGARLKDPLTASMALVWFGRRQPIAQVQALAYGLLKKVAKAQVKQAFPAACVAPAALAWHRLTVAEIGSVDSVSQHDWHFDTARGRVQAAGLPYLLGDPPGPAEPGSRVGSLVALKAVRDSLRQAPEARSRLREVLGLLPHDLPAAEFRLRRWCEIDSDKAALIYGQLRAVFGESAEPDPSLPVLLRRGGGSPFTPLGDVLALLSAEATPPAEGSQP